MNAPVRRICCPICGKSFEPQSGDSLPFCSLRCKQIDLARWLDEKYGLPYEREEKGEADQPPAAGP